MDGGGAAGNPGAPGGQAQPGAQQQQAQQQQVGPGAQQAAPVPFALAPGRVTNDIIDYSGDKGQKLWKALIDPLEQKYDGEPKTAQSFVEIVKDTIVERGWEAINELEEDGEFVLWLDRYAEYDLPTLRQQVETYAGTESRAAQDSFAMYTFLIHSLEKTFHQRISYRKDEYTVNGMGSGVLLLKVILSAVHHDLKGQATTIRDRLVDLPSHIKTLKYDVEKFNDYVKEQIAQLEARGETSTDLVTYLFRAYQTVPDKDFADYIKQKKSKMEDGEEDYTPQQLMQLAINKYKLITDQQKWLSKSDEEEQIIALMAELKDLKKKNLQLSDKLKPRAGTSSNKGTRRGRNNAKGKDDKDTSDKGEQKIPAWKRTRKGNTLKRNGKTYHWCTHHKFYTMHKSEDCSLKDKPATQTTTLPATTEQAANAIMAILQPDDE
jgi:hypothetical protein